MQVDNRYWAGFFDGEGCVMLEKYFSKTHSKKCVVGVRVCVTQKEPIVLYLLEKKFGGGVLRPDSKDIHRWQCGKASEVRRFLEAIKPYVIVKAVEVNIALEMLTRIEKPRGVIFKTSPDGKKLMAGRPSLGIDEIESRELLKKQFYIDRADPKIIKN